LATARGVAVALAVAGGWFAALGVFEHGARPFFTSDAAEFRGLANNLSRSSVTLITTVFGCLFFAIPLTANIYSPQIIESFWRGRTNRLVLGLYVFSAANAVWLTSVPARDGDIPHLHLTVSFALVMASLFILLPFLFSIFRLIDPESIIARTAANVIETMRPPPGAKPRTYAPPEEVLPPDTIEDPEQTTAGVRRRASDQTARMVLVDDSATSADVERQERLERRINELGAVLLRTLERGEREFAVDAVSGVVEAGRYWLEVKPCFGPETLGVDSRRLHGFSPAAIRLVNAERTWVDLMLMQQLSRGFASALTRAPDVVSAIGRALRHYALAATERGDDAVLRLTLRFLNNALRDAVKKLDLYAVYDLLFQCSELALRLWPTHPGSVLEMLRRADQYGRRASAAGLVFAHALVAYDFGRVLLTARPQDPRFGDLLRAYLAVSYDDASGGLHRLFVKARLVTASRLAAEGRRKEATAIVASLEAASDEVFASAAAEVAETVDPWFWEVTDRQENLDWLAPQARREFDAITAARLGDEAS
jgi:hypothetical protein